ncbi:MAG: serine/threonine-protein kinase [Pseudomonadota bacterium]
MSAPRQIPQQIGKYRIDGVLGTGAMGVVYKGYDPTIDREVAIKTIRQDLLSDDDAGGWRERFAREVRTAARCIHPNVVTIFEFGEAGGAPYIVMEYCACRPLSDFLLAKKPFEVSAALFVISQVLSALGAAHASGVVHRDVKPGNILLLDSGAVKVTDFGIARVESSTMTAHGSMIGTPSYMSPEQFMASEVDQRSDIFSAAIVAYELLTGQRPFVGGNSAEIMYRVMNEPPASMVATNPGVAPGVEQAVLRALAKAPQDRYATAQEFAQGLAQASDQTAATIIAPAQPKMAPRPQAGFEEAVLAQAERRLARVVGPIAKVMVKRAAGRCGSVTELYRALAEDIGDAKAAAEFMRKSGGQAAADTAMRLSTSISQSSGQRVAIDPETLTATQSSLASYLGPVARVLVQKASAKADSLEGFYRLLADSIPGEAERTAFLRKHLG